MYAQVEKPKENKSSAVANSIALKKCNGLQGVGFVDNRPSSLIQMKVQESVHANQREKRLSVCQDHNKANRSATIQKYQYINSNPPSTKDAQIYEICPMNTGTTGNCMYVGQTDYTRIGNRFIEHVRDDAWAPWYTGNGCDYSDNDFNNWPYVPRTLEELKNVTKFEVTAAEQWWITKKGGKGSLQNRINAMVKKTFLKYKIIPNNYDHNKIGVSDSWAPKV